MNWQADDPTRPYNMQPPSLARDPDVDFISRVVNMANESVRRNHMTLRDTMKSFLLYAFMSETDFPPSRAILTEKRMTNGEIHYSFEEKGPSEETFRKEYDGMRQTTRALGDKIVKVQSEIAAKDVQIDVLHTEIRQLKEQLRLQRGYNR